MFLSSPVPNPL